MDMYQYGDLPQIPFPDDYQLNSWTNTSLPYRQVAVHVEDDLEYSGLGSNGGLGMRRVERFLVDPCSPTPAFVQAKFDPDISLSNQMYGDYKQWPTPGLVRYNSPDGTSVSGTSSYATQNEAHSPSPYHSNPYGSPEESMRIPFPYPTPDHIKTDILLAGGSINPRDIEYEHPEPELATEEVNAADIKIDATFEQESVYMKADTVPDVYKGFSDSGVGSSVRDAESVQPIDQTEEDSSDYEYIPKSNRRRRSSASNSNSGRHSQRRRSHHDRKNSATSMPNTNRINKRTGRAAGGFGGAKGANDAYTNGDALRHFPCPLATYGCQSTFSSKNEWKRHVGTQHIKLGFWRCDLCTTTIDPHDDQTFYHNDFNRKDLFTQHLRRMHAAPANQSIRNHKDYPVTEENIGDHQKRCFQKLRGTPPQSSCLYCDETFKGPNSWEMRIEHIGRHLEKERKAGLKLCDVKNWSVDKELERWLLEEGIIAFKKGEWKIGDGRPRRHSLSGEDDDFQDEA